MTCLTFTLVLIRAVLTVDLSVAAEAQVDALPAVTLELGLGADGTVLLIAAVVTLRVTITPPCLRDAVHLTGRAGELLRGTGGGLCGTGTHRHTQTHTHTHTHTHTMRWSDSAP